MMKNLGVSFLFMLFALISFGQPDGGAGWCHVTGDPDNVTIMEDVDINECNTAFDRVAQIVYFFDPSGTAGVDQWTGYSVASFAGDSNTQVTDVNKVGTNLELEVKNVITDAVIATLSIPLTDIAPIQSIVGGTGITATAPNASGEVTISADNDHVAATVTDGNSIDLTITGQDITAEIVGAAAASNGEVATSDGAGGITFQASSDVKISTLQVNSSGEVVATLTDASTVILDMANIPEVSSASDLDTRAAALPAGGEGIVRAAAGNVMGLPASAKWGTLIFIKK